MIVLLLLLEAGYFTVAHFIKFYRQNTEGSFSLCNEIFYSRAAQFSLTVIYAAIYYKCANQVTEQNNHLKSRMDVFTFLKSMNKGGLLLK